MRAYLIVFLTFLMILAGLNLIAATKHHVNQAHETQIQVLSQIEI